MFLACFEFFFFDRLQTTESKYSRENSKVERIEEGRCSTGQPLALHHVSLSVRHNLHAVGHLYTFLQRTKWWQSWWPLTLWPYLGGYPALVFARQSLTGAQQDQAAVSLQGEQGGLLRVEDPGPHGDDLTGVLVRPGPDPRHAACKCFMLSRIISRLSSTATATASTAIQ